MCPSMPVRPGFRSSRASSTPRVTSSVLAPGNFSTTSSSPSPSPTTASPMSGWWSTTTWRRRRGAACRRCPSTGTWPSSAGSAICSSRCRTCSRCCGVSMKPPVPGVDASRKVSGETTARCRRSDDLLQRDALLAQALRVDQHLELPFALAQDRHVGDAGDAHQARPDGPPGEDGLLDQRQLVRGDRPTIITRLDEESGWSIIGGFGHVRQRVRLGQPLLHDLAGPIDVGAGLEDQDDGRQPGDRLRADLVDARDTVEQVGLERDGDELLDLLGGQAERLGLDLDVGRGELGQDVHRRGGADDTDRRMPTATRDQERNRRARRQRSRTIIYPQVDHLLTGSVGNHGNASALRTP